MVSLLIPRSMGSTGVSERFDLEPPEIMNEGLELKKRGGVLNIVNRRIDTFSHSNVTWYLYQKESAPEGVMQKAPQVVRLYLLTRRKLSFLF